MFLRRCWGSGLGVGLSEWEQSSALSRAWPAHPTASLGLMSGQAKPSHCGRPEGIDRCNHPRNREKFFQRDNNWGESESVRSLLRGRCGGCVCEHVHMCIWGTITHCAESVSRSTSSLFGTPHSPSPWQSSSGPCDYLQRKLPGQRTSFPQASHYSQPSLSFNLKWDAC